jgi:membrane associated rhomboid family serine protease
MFAHKRYEHFKGNVGFLFLLLCWYEIEHGKRRLAGVILFGAIGGCISHLIARDTNLMGASPVIWALVVANIIATCPYCKRLCLDKRLFNLSLLVPKVLILIWTGGYLYDEWCHPPNTLTSNPSHLGGAFAGILFEVIIATTKALRKRQGSDASSNIEEGNPQNSLEGEQVNSIWTLSSVVNDQMSEPPLRASGCFIVLTIENHSMFVRTYI